MKHLIKSLFLSLSLSVAGASFAADNPNLLVMGADADKDSVPRDSRVFKRVIASLQSQMSTEGFDVYDETYVTLGEFTQGRTRRTVGELADIAQSIQRPPIDVVVEFTIYASAKRTDYTTKVRARIEGRMINAKTGKFLDNFEVDSGKSFNVKNDCNRECILEAVGKRAKVLGNDLGSVLAEKLDWLVGGNQSSGLDRSGTNDYVTDYYLVFDGFSAEDYLDIEEYLVIFSGYDAHRVVEQRHTRAEIMYKSSIGSSKLNRNINKMLGELEMRATVNFNGNEVEVKRIKLRGEKRKPKSDDGW